MTPRSDYPPAFKEDYEPTLHKEQRDGVVAVFITFAAIIGGSALCIAAAIMMFR